MKVSAELDAIRAILAERVSSLATENERLRNELAAVTAERDALAQERDSLLGYLDSLHSISMKEPQT